MKKAQRWEFTSRGHVPHTRLGEPPSLQFALNLEKLFRPFAALKGLYISEQFTPHISPTLKERHEERDICHSIPLIP